MPAVRRVAVRWLLRWEWPGCRRNVLDNKPQKSVIMGVLNFLDCHFYGFQNFEFNKVVIFYEMLFLL